MENKKYYAQREKVYLNGSLFPFIKVGMQKVNLTPTVDIVNGEKVVTPNAPVIYMIPVDLIQTLAFKPMQEKELRNSVSNGFRNVR